MKSKSLGLAVLAAATAALVAACGGGGGSQASVQLTGVAATGLALANSTVDVKCASGTGSATTNESGSYTVTVADGKLPCIVKVTGMAGGVPVTLHSLAEGTGTTATANVTPLTEMILARAAGTMPSDLFENFSGSAVTGSALSQATTDILTVLGGALGIDLSGVDPFKATLVAATTSNPTGGNGYDQLLDQLGETVTPAMLPQVVSQIASTTGSSAPVTLEQVVANVQAGSLAGCPQALSGKYRVVDYWGEADEITLNFGTMKVIAGDREIEMVKSDTQSCEVKVNDYVDEVFSTVVFGPAGAGAIRDAEGVGFIFPVQSHRLSAVAGDWEFMESGVNESKLGEHFVGKMTFAADGSATVCEYDVMLNSFSECKPDTDEAIRIDERPDGAFTLAYGSSTSPVFGFRAPDGTLTLFGVNNDENSDGHFRTLFVLTKPQTATSPPVGSVSKYWDLEQNYAPPVAPATEGTMAAKISANEVTVTALEGNLQTRKRTSDGRIDTFQLNEPIAGLRFRPQGPYSAVYQRFLPGTGMSFYIDGQSDAHFAGVVVTRP